MAPPKNYFKAESNPNQPRLDRLFQQIEELLQEAQTLDVDPMRVKLAMKYFSGKYGNK